jgi:PAS domain S-box-containing protein
VTDAAPNSQIHFGIYPGGGRSAIEAGGSLQTLASVSKWAMRRRWRLSALFLMPLFLTIALFAWAVERRVWSVGLLSIALGLGLSIFIGSLYSRLETGNRFIELSVDMFCIIGFDGYFKNVNPSWEKTLGFSTEELMSKPRVDFIHPDDRSSTAKENERLQHGEITLAFENRYLCKDGSYKWLLWNAVSAPEQRVIYAVARDMTRKKHSEANLRESEERYRMLFELNPQPTWIYDRETLRFLAVNNAAVQKYGYSREEFLSMTIEEIRPPEDTSAPVGLATLREGKRECGVWKHRKKDGDIISVEITSYSSVFVGRSVDFVMAVDVTERLRAELERQQFTESLEKANQVLEMSNREIERATQLKSKFLACMSHELRTPLNAIVGFSDLLADGSPGDLNVKQKRFVNHIKQASAHLLQLINDILDLSKIEAGQLELHCEEFRVEDAVPEVLSTIHPLAMAKNIQIQQKLEARQSVYADRVRFKQLLYNLLSNAVKFTPKGGSVDLRGYDDGASVCVAVTDTGIGIRLEDQQAIFQEFRQIESNTTAAQQGTGLGLAITKRLVEQQGGRIWFESQLGKGSCFSFALPRGGTSAELPAAGAGVGAGCKETESRQKPLILVVDDEVPARELLANYLEPQYTVALAGSGEEAVKKAQQLLPDAITLDVLMPGRGGFETLAALRATPETARIPVIIVSIVDQQKMGFALGATDYLIKPIQKPVLLRTLRKYIPAPESDDSSILVVDDDPRNLELVGEALRSAGYGTHSVQSGAQALDVLSSHSVGAVLLDLLMPGMDGFQVLRHLRQEPASRDLPILIMTAKTLTHEEQELLRRETQGLFHKQGSWQQQLVAEVSRVVRNRELTKAAGQT